MKWCYTCAVFLSLVCTSNSLISSVQNAAKIHREESSQLLLRQSLPHVSNVSSSSDGLSSRSSSEKTTLSWQDQTGDETSIGPDSARLRRRTPFSAGALHATASESRGAEVRQARDSRQLPVGELSASAESGQSERETVSERAESRGRSDGETGISSVLNNIISILGGNVRVAASDPSGTSVLRPRPGSVLSNHFQPPHPPPPPHPLPHTSSLSQSSDKPSRINNRGPPQFYDSKLATPNRFAGSTSQHSPASPLLTVRRPPVAPFMSAIPLPEQIVPLLTRPHTQPTGAAVAASRTGVPVLPTPSVSTTTQTSLAESTGVTIKFSSQQDTLPSSQIQNPAASFESILSDLDSRPTSRPYVPLPPRFVNSTILRTGILPSLESIESISPSATVSSPSYSILSTTVVQTSPADWIEVPSTTEHLAATTHESSTHQSTTQLSDTPTPPLLMSRPADLIQGHRRTPPQPPTVQPRPPPSRLSPTSVSVPRLGVGEIFDITVKASQGFGGQAARPNPTGQSYIIPVDINQLREPSDIITRPDPTNNFVSIDGRRTYFDLQPKATANPATLQTVGAAVGFNGARPPAAAGGGGGGARPSVNRVSHTQPAEKTPQYSPPSQPPPPPRRPPPPTSRPSVSRQSYRRTSPPPVRIDTCIVGDDSTCNEEEHERCFTEHSVSSCVCRPGYSRLRPRTPCQRVVSLVMTVKVGSTDSENVIWNAGLTDSSSDQYDQLVWQSRNAINAVMSSSALSAIYMGNEVSAVQPLADSHSSTSSSHSSSRPQQQQQQQLLLVNTTVQLLDTQLSRQLATIDDALRLEVARAAAAAASAPQSVSAQSQSPLTVHSSRDTVVDVRDFDECSNERNNDCSENARCENMFGGFRCVCLSGYDDKFEDDGLLSGRYCLGCTNDYCNDRGVCSITDGQKVCRCRDQYYGSYCNIDGEVLGAALGATAVAAIVIVATFVGLCKWSKRWQKSQHQSKLEMGTLGASTAAFSYMKPPSSVATLGQSRANLALSLNERMRWAQLADAMSQQQSIYAPDHIYGVMTPAPMSLYSTQPTLKATLTEPPQSLGYSAVRPTFSAMARRSMTPQPLMDQRSISGGGGGGGGGGSMHPSCTPLPMAGRGAVTPLDLDLDMNDREERMSRIGHPVPRPRSRASITTQHMLGDLHDAEQREVMRLRGLPLSPAYSARRHF